MNQEFLSIECGARDSSSSPFRSMADKGAQFMREDAMQLALEPREQEVLSWAVKNAISDLGTEIGHTDNRLCGKTSKSEREFSWRFLTGSASPPKRVSSLHASAPNFRGRDGGSDEPRPVALRSMIDTEDGQE